MHKQRVLEPVIELPLVGISSDCIHFLLLLSLIGFLPLFLDCHVFDLPLPPPPPPLPIFHPPVDQRSRGGREGGRGGEQSSGQQLVYKGQSLGCITLVRARMHSNEPAIWLTGMSKLKLLQDAISQSMWCIFWPHKYLSQWHTTLILSNNYHLKNGFIFKHLQLML